MTDGAGSNALQPGALLGVLGGGQLGRMFALAARRMGYRVAVYSPAENSPTGVIADREFIAPYEDLAQVEAFAREVDVVTFEFENVPSATAEAAARHAPVRPDGALLHTTQNRRREKEALRGLGLPVADFACIESESDLAAAQENVPFPAVLKTAAWGYDGKGQRKVETAADLPAAWRELDQTPSVLETWVTFEREVSVIGARSVTGEIALYRPLENEHVDHILDLTMWPARLEESSEKKALEVAHAVFDGLDVVGVLCVEMFVQSDGEVLVNELAPRPHNSGHLTIDAHETSQFEQQVRAICGLPLGSVAPLQPAAAMANLLGHAWENRTPDWGTVLSEPGVKLHLYGKTEPRLLRKMGHLNATGATLEAAVERVQRSRNRLLGN